MLYLYLLFNVFHHNRCLHVHATKPADKVPVILAWYENLKAIVKSPGMVPDIKLF